MKGALEAQERPFLWMILGPLRDQQIVIKGLFIFAQNFFVQVLTSAVVK
jgi:hypothetical protein